ncbi:response regulator transcription factor [Herbivorax sp. ANBcel31]|uniref:response regulator transcription factor n=1 Tax=Herbivorax sp. ANBcel31 TaxID=3069754 RepID=UPI0027B81B7D|nr:response regulator transcription factor [Herbivorax sp. ANBcel31]MDQ2086737.1 response regulator transcription factor [Herbivorax sp. ANBcel31]
MIEKTIFLVEDEKHIQELVKFNLEEKGYKVSVFENGEDLLSECKNKVPDLFILDVMLPGIDGFEICKKLRQNIKLEKIPVIMLTAKSDEFDKVFGLEIGADDYITKPFSIRELVARVKAMFRRSDSCEISDDEVVKAGNITIDFSKREVSKNGEILELSYKEFEILRLLMINKGKVLSREILLEKIWGFDYFGETRTVDVHIRYLRQKIEDDDNQPFYIETVRGIGYRFTDKKG